MKKKAAVILGLAVAAILLPSLLSPRIKTVSEPSALPEGGIRCVLDLGAYEDSTHGLINGYNYHLLQQFAQDYGIKAEVLVARSGEFWMDSLESGRIDAVVLPLHQTGLRAAAYSIPVDNLTTWAVNLDNFYLLQAFDKWLDNYLHSSQAGPTHRAFIRVVGNPQRLAENGGTRSSLSPYDNLFRKYATTLDWDWKLLAAVCFSESRFHIEARSPRGAQGLMQLMPSTAEAHQVSDPLDPEQNIAAGARYLRRLMGIFSSRFDNEDEQLRYALAAYNAGEGNILGSLDGTLELELQWDYVDRVFEVYDAFCEICP
jgi:membrane-bound lytic murein transglycosylase F